MIGQPYFVIFGTMRSGSNLLEKTIEALGDTVCHGEAFNPGFVGGPRRLEILGWDAKKRDANPLGFLETLISGAGPHIPGFRIFDGHSQIVMARALADPDCRRVLLRRDPLESYISLKIARETDQWMLRRISKRVAARVTFDPDEFDEYRTCLDEHYAWLDAQMHAAGTSALRVTYDSLSDPVTLETVARHIGSQGNLPQGAPIVRQNPEPFSEKIINYSEMCEFLDLEPEVPPPLTRIAGAAQVMLPERAPLAYVPLAGPGFDLAISIMYRIEQRGFDGPQLSNRQLMDGAAAGTLFQTGMHAADLAVEITERKVFTILCHPVVRLHGLFLDELFGRNWLASPIRKKLQCRFGGFPSAREINRKEKILEPDLHRSAFLAFLEMIERTLAGAGDLVPQPGWHPQARLLAAAREEVRIDRAAFLDDLPTLCDWLTEEMEFGGLPQNHVTALRKRANDGFLPLSEGLTPEILGRIEEFHREDFVEFDLTPKLSGYI